MKLWKPSTARISQKIPLRLGPPIGAAPRLCLSGVAFHRGFGGNGIGGQHVLLGHIYSFGTASMMTKACAQG